MSIIIWRLLTFRLIIIKIHRDMGKLFCIITAIIIAFGAMLVGKNASSMFGYYMAKFMGIAAAIFIILAFVVPGSGVVVDTGYCVLTAIALVLLFVVIFFKLLPYIIGIAIVGVGIWLLAWLFRNASADGGGTVIVISIICFISLCIVGLIKKAVK